VRDLNGKLKKQKNDSKTAMMDLDGSIDKRTDSKQMDAEGS
jgi:hypothetical protein